jgi:ArsR family transcriptional regulator
LKTPSERHRKNFSLYITGFPVTNIFIMSDPVTFSRALGDATRWRIIRLVKDEALCVCELADILDMPQSSVSSHVQVIRKAGLLESEKCEKWTYFRIDSRFLKLLETMEKFFGDAGNSGWNEDAEKAARRLEERIGSCCPGPELLVSRSHKKSKISKR